MKINYKKYLSSQPSREGFLLDLVLAVLIFLSIILYILSTYGLDEGNSKVIKYFNYGLLAIFSIEIILRFYFTTRKEFFTNFLNWIDILAIMSFWFTETNFQFLRIFRILRFFRFSKKYSEYFITWLGKNEFEKFFVVKTFFIISLLLFVSSSLIYTFEVRENEKIENFFNAFYFVVSTVTTVGFGDITAITTIGQVITVFTIFLGVMVIPYNLTLLLKEVLRTKVKIQCKSCGLEHHDKDAVFCKHCGEKVFQPTPGED